MTRKSKQIKSIEVSTDSNIFTIINNFAKNPLKGGIPARENINIINEKDQILFNLKKFEKFTRNKQLK